jgi:hypothetical protein
VITLYVHPIDAVLRPDQAGWRWAVHLDDQPSSLTWCVNAGHAADRREAVALGDMCAATLARGLSMSGRSVGYAGVVVLDSDPVPAGADTVSFV